MAPYRIIKQGYMLKEPPYSKRGMRKKLKRFWFVLLEDKKQVAFVYYKNEDAYIARQRNVGFIRIDNSRINVIGDYLTYKNAFEIITEKSEYTFVSETRYELHDWIFVLHNTLEGFHRRMERVRVRMEQRQRVLSASSVASDNPSSQASPTPIQQPGPTPPTPRKRTTPTHPSPNESPKTGSSSRRRPRRPAPLAPQLSRDTPQSPETSHTPNHTHQEFPQQYSHEGPIPIPQVPTFPYAAAEDHPVLDLDITQMDETPREEEEGEGGEREEEREAEEVQRYVIAPIHTSNMGPQTSDLRPAPVHQRSVSDTSLLLCRTNSTSLPELAGPPSSASPEPISDPAEGVQILQESPTKKFRTKHTRHLSLLGGDHHKRKKRRSQIRCRSPPNYPPPPPPANEESGDEIDKNQQRKDEIDKNQQRKDEIDKNQQRKDSPGFSKVMQTISSIDQELQEMGGVAGADTAANVPPPTMFHGEDPPINPANDVPERAGQGQVTGEEEGRIEEGISTEMGGSPTAEAHEETGVSLDQLPAGQSSGDDQQPAPLESPTKKLPPPVAAKPKLKPKPKPKKNKVMFKEEVEDIPSYEPRIDDEEAPPTSEGSEDIPSSVAALKQILFGQASTQKYSKEGPMSLRFGAFVDTEDYDENLHELLTPTSQQQSEPQFSPEVIQQSSDPAPSDPHYQHLARFNSSSQPETGEMVRGEGEGGSASQPTENEYDAPWDSKPISKFSVVSHRSRLTPSPAHRTESFEVISHTTDLPGNMERRHVNSLERQLKNDPNSRLSLQHDMGHSATTSSSSQLEFSDPSLQDSDLLHSISTTLQTRSKYGSDSFLTSFSQGDVPANYYQQQGRAAMQQAKSGGRSARGDLEKIRTQHKRAITLPTAYSGHQTSQLQQKKALSRSHQSVSQSSVTGDGRGGGRGKGRATSYHGGGPAHKAQSVDKLSVDPSTLVTYNTYTKSHTLQSLV